MSYFNIARRILDLRTDVLNVREELLMSQVFSFQWASVVLLACGNTWIWQGFGFIGLVSALVLQWWMKRQNKKDATKEDTHASND